MFRTKVVEKSKNTFRFELLFLESRAVYEIMWKNMVKPDGPRITIQYGACTWHAGIRRLQTHSEYVILIAFTRKRWLRERTSVFMRTLSVFLLLSSLVLCPLLRLTSSTLLTAYTCGGLAVGRETRRLSDNMRALYKLNVCALALLQPVLRSLYSVGGITVLIFPFSHIFRFIALVTAILYLLSFYNAERDSQS
jgi:hypothetical protein